ncbi:uncharacterized protein LOC105249850 [Camponotus floridanus]|uniref:uncharacterized protein LOC105249850 n=1 Tax=Camponotus floridanus TaxID=104421 RepID=UPI00059BA82B|nr:uncharacterized protein LOC105249850 [Camponotus floridanus]
MEIRSLFITILVVAFAFLHYGEAKRCYKCDSRTSKTCVSEPSWKKEVESCPIRSNCATCHYKFYNGTKVLIRSCGTNNSSSVHYLDLEYCILCNKDLCNNANIITVSMTLGCLVSFWAIRFVLTNSY